MAWRNNAVNTAVVCRRCLPNVPAIRADFFVPTDSMTDPLRGSG
jgi:hypothetical protein